MQQEVAIRAKLYGDYDSDGVPEVAEYAYKPGESHKMKAAPSDVKHKRILNSNKSLPEGVYAPIRDEISPDLKLKNTNYTSMPRTRTNTINHTNPPSTMFKHSQNKVLVGKSQHVGGFKATGGQGYSTVPSKGLNKSMEF